MFDPLVRDDVGSGLTSGVTVLSECESDEYNVVIVTVAFIFSRVW